MKSSNLDPLEYDTLAVGLTRPPMIFGVMLVVVFSNLMLCCLIYIYVRTLYAIPLFGALHLTAAYLSIKEPRFLMLYWQWISKTPPVRNYRYWGNCNSYLPE